MEQVVMEPEGRWISETKLVSLVISCKDVTNLELVVTSPAERVLLVVVSAATKAQSLAVAVASLAMASTVSC